MNQVIKELKERKSVRAYRDEEITLEEKNMILQAAIQAPTAGNMALYSIIDVQDQQLKNQLAETCDHQPFISQAPLVLLFLADYQKWYDMYCAYHDENIKLEEADMILALEDAMIAAQNAVMGAWSLGIGSCYIGDILENFEIHQKLFGVSYITSLTKRCDNAGRKRHKGDFQRTDSLKYQVPVILVL